MGTFNDIIQKHPPRLAMMTAEQENKDETAKGPSQAPGRQKKRLRDDVMAQEVTYSTAVQALKPILRVCQGGGGIGAR